MKKYIIPLMIVALTGCINNTGYTKAEDAQDAGREFIRAALDGDHKKANFYLLKDTANLALFDRWKTDMYDKLSKEEKDRYRDASIRPLKIEPLNDSTVLYQFTNSYKEKDTTIIYIVKKEGEWLIDLKLITK